MTPACSRMSRSLFPHRGDRLGLHYDRSRILQKFTHLLEVCLRRRAKRYVHGFRRERLVALATHTFLNMTEQEAGKNSKSAFTHMRISVR